LTETRQQPNVTDVDIQRRRGTYFNSAIVPKENPLRRLSHAHAQMGIMILIDPSKINAIYLIHSFVISPIPLLLWKLPKRAQLFVMLTKYSEFFVAAEGACSR
jgi:hypothetical protein